MKQVELDAQQMGKLGAYAEQKEDFILEVLEELDRSKRFAADRNDPAWPKRMQEAFQENVSMIGQGVREGLRDFLVADMPSASGYWNKVCINTVKPAFCEEHNVTFSPLALGEEIYDTIVVLVDSINEAGIYDFHLGLDFEMEAMGNIMIMVTREAIKPADADSNEGEEVVGKE